MKEKHDFHLVPFPFLGLACAPIVETRFLELAMSLLTFHLEYPLVLSRFCFHSEYLVRIERFISTNMTAVYIKGF